MRDNGVGNMDRVGQLACSSCLITSQGLFGELGSVKDGQGDRVRPKLT